MRVDCKYQLAHFYQIEVADFLSATLHGLNDNIVYGDFRSPSHYCIYFLSLQAVIKKLSINSLNSYIYRFCCLRGRFCSISNKQWTWFCALHIRRCRTRDRRTSEQPGWRSTKVDEVYYTNRKNRERTNFGLSFFKLKILSFSLNCNKEMGSNLGPGSPRIERSEGRQIALWILNTVRKH